MTTAQNAIARSISHNEIVTLDYDMGALAELKSASEGAGEASSASEFWGTSDDGDEWRVHVRRREPLAVIGARVDEQIEGGIACVVTVGTTRGNVTVIAGVPHRERDSARKLESGHGDGQWESFADVSPCGDSRDMWAAATLDDVPADELIALVREPALQAWRDA